MISISLHPTVSFNPADATTYYFGAAGVQPSVTVLDHVIGPQPAAGAIIRVGLRITIAVPGTAEDITFELFNFNSGASLDLGNHDWEGDRFLMSVPLNFPIARSDRWALRIITPTWITNPTGVRFETGMVYMEDNDEVAAEAAQDAAITARDAAVDDILAGTTPLINDALFAGVLTDEEMAALRSVLRLQVADESVILKGRSETVERYP